MFGMHKKMIGTSTNIRSSRRAFYPSISICPETWRDPVLNLKDNPSITGYTLNEKRSIETYPPVNKILQYLDYHKRTNETRQEQICQTIIYSLIRDFDLSAEERVQLRFRPFVQVKENRYDHQEFSIRTRLVTK